MGRWLTVQQALIEARIRRRVQVKVNRPRQMTLALIHSQSVHMAPAHAQQHQYRRLSLGPRSSSRRLETIPCLEPG